MMIYRKHSKGITLLKKENELNLLSLEKV